MAISTAYTDLLTEYDLHDAAQGGVGLDSVTNLVEIIQEATAVVETFLDRPLIVRSHTQRFGAKDWRQREGYETTDDRLLSTAWAYQWPVVEVVSVDGDTALADDLEVHDYGRDADVLLAYDTAGSITEVPHKAVYFAGYRRHEQTLAGLQAESGLSDLTELPPVLPPAIRRACKNLCYHMVEYAGSGLYGRRQMQQQVGGGAMATVDSFEKDYVDRVLKDLVPYRRMV